MTVKPLTSHVATGVPGTVGVMTQNPDLGAGTPISLAGLRAGTEVGGYRLIRRLGAGGMGVVWEVADGAGNHIAMKILHPQIAADPMARRRLDREASVLARVRDSRVARILDIETGDGADGTGVTFVITELVDGPTLQYEVDHEGAYDLTTDARDLADLAHGLVDSLSAVHAAGVIHRDLKPSNVMLGAQGPVLIDFGIAQVADDVRLTQTGQVTGTPGFIPPEMLDGDEPSPDVDWYACAGVLLFAVTGQAPFGSGPWQAVFRRVYAGSPELGSLEEDCPALARAFAAALAPRVADRLAIEDLLRVLDEIADGGTGQEAIDEALGAEADEADEADAATSTFASGYGVVGAQHSTGYGSGPSAPSASGYGDGASGPSAGAGPHGGRASPADYGYVGAAGGPGTPAAGPGRNSEASPAFSPGGGPAPEAMASGGGMPVAYAPGSGSSGYPAPGGPARRPSPAPMPVQQPAVMSARVPVGPAALQPALPQPAPMARRPGAEWPYAGPAMGSSLPGWAREPRRHPFVVFSLFVLLVSLSASIPVWVMLVYAVLLVVAGTVGRADDARRWRRLEAGRVCAGDTSRMWAAMPWYLVSSFVTNVFALIPALIVSTIIFLLAGGSLLGESSGSTPTILEDWASYDRGSLLMCCVTAPMLLVAWMVPWGSSTRRGAARMIGAALGTRSRLVIGTVVVLALAAGVFVLHGLGILPPAWLHPFATTTAG